MLKEIDRYNNLIKYISSDIRIILSRIPNSMKIKIEEIRLRINKPLNINYQGKDYFLNGEGNIVNLMDNALIITKEHINNTFQLLTNHSIYAYSEEIKKGFITISGGHRVGLGGKAIYGENGLESIKDISSLNIRIAREKKGVSDDLLPYVIENAQFSNTLIISPPQCGKTTLLRDLVRNLSNGDKLSRGFKVGLIDERSEIAGVFNGMPQNDIGIRTDILDGCNKVDGIMMFIRSMSPEIIAVDEIGGSKDIEAIGEALRAGIRLLATIHGNNLNEISNRYNMKTVINQRIFKRYIILDNSKGVGTISKIIEGENFNNLYPMR